MATKMKVTLQKISAGDEEAVIYYRKMTQRIEGIVRYLEGQNEKMLVERDGERIFLDVCDILYLESVDGATFLYTKAEVYRTALTLALFANLYTEEGFFRCNKAMILNIYRIQQLKSISGNRIDAKMDNGEHIVISRRYAKELRSILKGDGQ
ncbi:MAG: LytTR family transcriptional regulator DNA-binding domain-containing protein [Lachnospiraceae bacterium]|nr:LytTR family transcriptional regulator DNA-binding domain-containing protein [Lachnospiraceae bacterium]